MSIDNLTEARKVAEERISQIAKLAGGDFIIIKSIEVPEGWIFFYNSREYVETKDDMFALIGNGPVFVNRLGSVEELTSALPWKDALQKLRET